MKLHFVLAGAVAIGLLISAPDSMAHGGGGGGGGGGGHGGGSFHGGGFHGGFHSGGFHGHGRFYGGRFFGPAVGFYGYGYGYPWYGWGYAGYPGYGGYGGYGYGDYDAYYGGSNEGERDPRFASTRAVQAALAWQGYYSGRVDGVMGPETSNAIRSFQSHQGLPVTGQVNGALINALQRR